MSAIVTMKTIAARARVTQATVSMSLANHPRIPAHTRERIQALARELEYRPNPFVSALMRSRRQGREKQDRPVLALINGLESPSAWKTSSALTVRQMRDGALARARERGYQAQEFWLGQDGMSAERFSNVLHARGIQGLILGPQLPGAPPPGLHWERFAAVRLGVPLPQFTLTAVCNDHFFSSLQVAQECHRLGYRRPGLVLLDMHRERFSGRWDGGLLAGSVMLPGLRPAKTLILASWKDLSAVPGWIEREKVDVVISPSADDLLSYLRRRGWRCPQDVGLASFACPEPDHPCSGIWQNGALLGATAIDQLISLLERNERGLPKQAHVIMVEGVWNPGQTLKPASGSAKA